MTGALIADASCGKKRRKKGKELRRRECKIQIVIFQESSLNRPVSVSERNQRLASTL